MRRAIFPLAVAAAGALAVAAAGSARSAEIVQLQMNDGFTVKGTHVLCEVETSKVLIPGVKVIGCVFANRSGAVPKTSVLIACGSPGTGSASRPSGCHW